MVVINSLAEQKKCILCLAADPTKMAYESNGLAGSARRIEDNRSHQADWRAP